MNEYSFDFLLSTRVGAVATAEADRADAARAPCASATRCFQFAMRTASAAVFTVVQTRVNLELAASVRLGRGYVGRKRRNASAPRISPPRRTESGRGQNIASRLADAGVREMPTLRPAS